jgi:hypothetical protein
MQKVTSQLDISVRLEMTKEDRTKSNGTLLMRRARDKVLEDGH